MGRKGRRILEKRTSILLLTILHMQQLSVPKLIFSVTEALRDLDVIFMSLNV